MAKGTKLKNELAKNRKKTTSLSVNNASSDVAMNGCATPCMKGCVVGQAIDPLHPPSSAEQFECSNRHCTVNRWLHKICIERLEEYLVKTMAVLPASRAGSHSSWTDRQRRQNIWNKKGFDTIFKHCKCKCGGFLRREVDGTVPVNEHPPTVAVPKKSKTKSKELPKLNTGVTGINNRNTSSLELTIQPRKRVESLRSAVGSCDSQARSIVDYADSDSESCTSSNISQFSKSANVPETIPDFDPSCLLDTKENVPQNSDCVPEPKYKLPPRLKSGNNVSPRQPLITGKIETAEQLLSSVTDLLQQNNGHLKLDNSGLTSLEEDLSTKLRKAVKKEGGIAGWLFSHSPDKWTIDEYEIVCTEYIRASPDPNKSNPIEQEHTKVTNDHNTKSDQSVSSHLPNNSTNHRSTNSSKASSLVGSMVSCSSIQNGSNSSSVTSKSDLKPINATPKLSKDAINDVNNMPDNSLHKVQSQQSVIKVQNVQKAAQSVVSSASSSRNEPISSNPCSSSTNNSGSSSSNVSNSNNSPPQQSYAPHTRVSPNELNMELMFDWMKQQSPYRQQSEQLQMVLAKLMMRK